MGRLNTMTDSIASKTLITGASYGPANELLSVTGGSYGGAWAYGVGETRTYNSLKQLTEIVSGTYSTPLSITYHYPSTGNNGKISSQTDNVSGEQVSYTYDALNRLSTAANQSGFSPLWGQQFAYDGFGNLTEVSVTQGSAPTMTASYDYKNHAGGEDSNGNPGSIYLPADSGSYAATYDVENRLVATGSSTIRYSYAPGNKRVWRGVGSWNSGTGQWSPTDEVTFWSVNGQKLATYQLTTTLGVGPPSPSEPQFYATQTACNYYFGGKLIKNVNGWVYSDRLASIGKFYPYGMERPSATTNGTEKFTGYFRDAETGNDYAVNRYASPGMGRFITPDPYRSNSGGPGNPSDPGSWNRYAYTLDDPINYNDPRGMQASCPADTACFGTTGTGYSDPDFGASPGLGDGGVPGPWNDPNGPKPLPGVPVATQFPTCNPGGTSTVANKLGFISAHYNAALGEADQVQTASGVQINTSSLAIVFLQWSMWESGYNASTPPPVVSVNNNYFGNSGGAGTIACPAGAQAGAVCYPAGTTWGQELQYGLSMVPITATNPNPNGLSYFQSLVNALQANPGLSAAASLQTIASAGWNTNTNYGSTITGGISGMAGLLNCLQTNYPNDIQ